MEAITQEAASDPQMVPPAQETPIVSTEVQVDTMEQSTAIPEKFRGKGPDEIVKSYTSLEAEYTKARQHMSELEKRAARADQLEMALSQVNNQPGAAPVHSTNIPHEEYYREWDRNPADAVLKVTEGVEKKVEGMFQDLQTRSHYEYARANYPGFAELEPIMMKMVPEISGFVRSDKIKSPEMINALYTLARAQTIDERERAAQARGFEEGNKLRQEKMSAFAEGPSTSGGTVPFHELTLSEMAKFLGRVDRS